MNELTQERLREVLDYDQVLGIFKWKVTRGSIRFGRVAGTLHHEGYIQVGIDGCQYFAHRLAWLYVHGHWPNKQLDHINGVRNDNRLENLREASVSENLQNQKKGMSNNTSNLLGVSYRPERGSWRAAITIKKTRHFLGDFDAPEKAHAAYLRAKAELHPFQTITETI